jgi:hypothetical protein
MQIKATCDYLSIPSSIYFAIRSILAVVHSYRTRNHLVGSHIQDLEFLCKPVAVARCWADVLTYVELYLPYIRKKGSRELRPKSTTSTSTTQQRARQCRIRIHYPLLDLRQRPILDLMIALVE